MEAFADTMVPGEKRHSGDRAIAGAAAGPGAVQAGTVELLCLPELGLAPLLPVLAELLDTQAVTYALARGRVLLPVLGSAFAGLGFRDRTALAAKLLKPGAVDQKLWVLLALFSSLAFDTAAHLHTTDALAQRHPGLTWAAFPPPDADGLWRFPEFGYGRELARTHPRTTSGGHPA
ncbi:regulator [Streptomyces sp. F63]|nr:regulator [Streptomyces sp. F63]